MGGIDVSPPSLTWVVPVREDLALRWFHFDLTDIQLLSHEPKGPCCIWVGSVTKVSGVFQMLAACGEIFREQSATAIVCRTHHSVVQGWLRRFQAAEMICAKCAARYWLQSDEFASLCMRAYYRSQYIKVNL